jgi:hypothetical protein
MLSDREKAVVWAVTATGGVLAASAVFWVVKRALDAYVPYQVSSRRILPVLPPVFAVSGLLQQVTSLCDITSGHNHLSMQPACACSTTTALEPSQAGWLRG